MKIQAKYKHTEGQMTYELLSCLNEVPCITFGEYLKLNFAEIDLDSPNAQEMLGEIPLKTAKMEFDAVNRVFEIMLADDSLDKRGKSSEYAAFGPEWTCDIIAKAANALPSLTWDQALKFPVVRLMHLAASGGRKEGMTTKRPLDIDDAWEQFKAWDKERLANENQG